MDNTFEDNYYTISVNGEIVDEGIVKCNGVSKVNEKVSYEMMKDILDQSSEDDDIIIEEM